MENNFSRLVEETFGSALYGSFQILGYYRKTECFYHGKCISFCLEIAEWFPYNIEDSLKLYVKGNCFR